MRVGGKLFLFTSLSENRTRVDLSRRRPWRLRSSLWPVEKGQVRMTETTAEVRVSVISPVDERSVGEAAVVVADVASVRGQEQSLRESRVREEVVNGEPED